MLLSFRILEPTRAPRGCVKLIDLPCISLTTGFLFPPYGKVYSSTEEDHEVSSGLDFH